MGQQDRQHREQGNAPARPGGAHGILSLCHSPRTPTGPGWRRCWRSTATASGACPWRRDTCSSPEALARLRATNAAALFPTARAPEAALAGLHLYFSCLEECHTLAQDIATAEGSYWHAIMHRQEPDPGNAGYWFRRVGAHPIFPALRDAAARLGYAAGAQWDPLAFIDACERRAAEAPAPREEGVALRVQLAEWQLLFDYCAAGG